MARKAAFFMKSIKVVHVANSDLGLKSHLGNLMLNQINLGYAVSAIASPGKWLTHDTTILNNIFVKIISLRSRIDPIEDIYSLSRLKNYFQTEHFDIVHTHSIKPGFLGRVAAKWANVPIIIHTFHGLSFYDDMPSARSHLYKFVERLGCLCGDSVLSQGRCDMDVVLKERICPSSKLHYLGNGIELGRFNPENIDPLKVIALRSQLGILPHQKVVGFIGRADREKGICEFVEAIDILKRQGIKAKYLIIGGQQTEKQSTIPINDLIQKSDAKEDLIFLGYRTDIPDLIATMDIVTLPSYHEGIPRCLMESAAMGKPVVATRLRGIQEIVLDGETGILVSVGDSSDLAKGIMKLVGDDRYRKKIGKSAREHALMNFDERSFFARTDIEYRRLIKEKFGFDAGKS